MKPGIYSNLSAAEYHALPGASASRLRKLWQSTPAHLKADLDGEREETDAMRLGTLAHALILEPEKPLPNLVVPPAEYAAGKPWNYNATVCKEWRAKQVEEGKTVVSADQYNGLMGMALAVAKHTEAGVLFSNGKAEVSCVGYDTSNAVDVRCRMDFVPTAKNYLCDLKTTHDASEREFARTAYNSAFHIQAALYLALYNALSGEERSEFRFVAVEQKPPHAVNVFNCSPEFLSKGRADMSRTLALFARCLAEDHWPAYGEEVKQLNLPKYVEAE